MDLGAWRPDVHLLLLSTNHVTTLALCRAQNFFFLSGSINYDAKISCKIWRLSSLPWNPEQIGSRGQPPGRGSGCGNPGSSYFLAIFKEQNQHSEAHSFFHSSSFFFCRPWFLWSTLPWISKPWLYVRCPNFCFTLFLTKLTCYFVNMSCFDFVILTTELLSNADGWGCSTTVFHVTWFKTRTYTNKEMASINSTDIKS